MVAAQVTLPKSPWYSRGRSLTTESVREAGVQRVELERGGGQKKKRFWGKKMAVPTRKGGRENSRTSGAKN